MILAAIGFDPTDPDVVADPFPTFAELRESDPAHWSDRLDGWVFTRYADVRASLNWSVDRIEPFIRAKDDFEASGLARVALWSSFNDPPIHTRLRRLMAKALSADHIDAMEADVHRLVGALMNEARPRGEMEVMADFAHAIPIGVMARMFDLPADDVPMLRHLSEEINLFVGAAKHVPNKYARSDAAVEAMTNYFTTLYDERASKPKDDLLGRLIRAEDDGERLDRDEVIATCVMLIYAGHVTTAHLLGNAVLALLRNPDQLAILRDDPTLGVRAGEELLRFDGPVQAMVRVATSDVELHGKTIRAGERVFPMLNAANRDPRRFDEPETLEIRREKNPHIVFGHGVHTCIGLRLARLEIPIALNAFLAATPQVEQCGPETWIDSVAFRGPASLPVRFAPTAPVR